jgi:hypothetical protein
MHTLPPDQLLALRQANTRRLKEIVAEYGWPIPSRPTRAARPWIWRR